MDARRSQLSTGLLVMTGVLFGWILAVSRPTPIQASAGDRNEESVLATGPVMVRHDESSNAPIPLDALYFLDYKGGRLLATVPSYRQVGTKLHFIDGFAERDLLADFKLESGQRTEIPDDDRLAGATQPGLGTVVCLRDDHPPGRRLSDAEHGGGRSVVAEVRTLADSQLSPRSGRSRPEPVRDRSGRLAVSAEPPPPRCRMKLFKTSRPVSSAQHRPPDRPRLLPR